MQTKPSVAVFATVAQEFIAEVKPAQLGPIELDLTAMRFVTGGLPRAGWGSEALVAEPDLLPRATW